MEIRSIESIVTALNTARVVQLPSGTSAPVVALGTLLEMKRAAGRPQDLIDITELERAR